MATISSEAFQRAVAQVSKAICSGGVRDVHYLRRLSETACDVHGCKGMIGEVLNAAKADNPTIRLRVAP